MKRTREINENGAFTHEDTFLNNADVATVPTTIRYRVDCLTTGTAIRDWTTVSPGTAITTFTLTADDNEIQDSCNAYELREVLIHYNLGLSTAKVKSHQYRVVNRYGLVAA